MVYCPNCNRWFKNKQALRAHLKHCPLKNSKNTETTVIERITVECSNGKRLIVEIQGEKGVRDIIVNAYKLVEKQYKNADITLKMALRMIYALKLAKKVQGFKILPAKQS